MRTNNPLVLKPFDAAEYLNAAAEMGDPAVLLAFAALGRANLTKPSYRFSNKRDFVSYY